MNNKKLILNMLTSVGVGINGKNPWDIRILNDKVFDRVLRDGDIGAGEGYVLGEWDCRRIDELIRRLNLIRLSELSKNSLLIFFNSLLQKILPKNSYEIAWKHYDLGNDLFSLMLDKRMVYTCGYWKDAKNLDEAQECKLDLVCKKLGLKPGMKVLDIGGGWGSFAKFAAQNYEVSVVNITVSKEQVALANNLCKGLKVENRLQDYKDLNGGEYDRIVSLGMFEHVRSKNFKTFFKKAFDHLKPDGLFLLHTIGASSKEGNDFNWIAKYIFPNSEIPVLKDLTASLEGLFVVEDWHNFGADYDKTLMSWYKNFNEGWDKIKNKYGERFYRMWKLYLLGCAGTFRARKLQLWQIVLSKNGILGGYNSIR